MAGSLAESRKWTPVLSLAMICSMMHEVPAEQGFPSMAVADQAAEPPVGLAEATTSPTASPATHMVLDAQEMLLRAHERISAVVGLIS